MANPNVPNTYIQELEGGFTPYLQNLRDQVASKQITEQAAYNQAAKDFNSVVSKDPNNRLNFSLAAQLAAGNVFGSEPGGRNVVNNFNSALQGNPADTLNIPTQQGMLSPPPVPVTTPTPPPAQPLGMLRPTTVPERFQGKSTEQIQTMLQQDVAPVPTATEITFANTENGIVRVESGQPIPPNSTITDSDSWLEQEMNVLKQQVIDKNNVTFVDTGNGIVRVQAGQPIPKGKKTDSGSWLEQEKNILNSKVTPQDVNPQAVTVGGTTNSVTLQPTVGMLGKSQELTTGKSPLALFEPAPFTEAQIAASSRGDERVLSDLFLNFNASGTDLTTMRPVVEQIANEGFNSTTNNTSAGDAASFGVRAVGRAIMKSDYNNAVLTGNTERAEQLQKAFNGTSDEAWGYYQENYPENSAHEMFQIKFADPFGIGEPGKYQKTFLDKIGDNIKDITENPYVQAAVSFWNPAAGAVLNAGATLNSGDKLTPMQVVAAVTGAGDLMGSGAGSAILKTLPKPLQDLIGTIDDITNGFTTRVSASLSKLFPEKTTKELIAFADAMANVAKPLKDAGIAAGDAVANVAEPFKDSGESFLNDFQNILDGFELPNFNQGGEVSQQELAGTPFRAQRGYQGGLAVDTDFLNETSSVLQLLQGLPLSTKQIA